MRILEHEHNAPPAPAIPPQIYEGRAAFIAVEWWPNREHRLEIDLNYYEIDGRVTSETLRIANPEPGMVLDVRNETGAPANAVIRQEVGTNLLTSWRTRLVVYEATCPAISTHSEHSQALPLGTVKIPNGAAYTAHSTFYAYRTGYLAFVYDSAGVNPGTCFFRVSALQLTGVPLLFYHGIGQVYTTSSPAVSRGHVTEQPRVAAAITQHGHVMAGIPYRLEINHNQGAPIDFTVDALIISGVSYS